MTAPSFIIFVPEVEAFGGAERSILALSHWLHARKLAHRVVLYFDRITLANYAYHPMDILVLNPQENPLHKVEMLKGYFEARGKAGPRPLMSGLQAALHASMAGIPGFHTLMHDTPSLLGDGPQGFGDRLRDMIRNRALRRGLNSGGTTMVTSEYLKAETERLWHPPVAIARMGGIAAKSFRPRVVGWQMRMLSVSRVEDNKRIGWLIRALAKLDRRSPSLSERIDWYFDIVGGGSLIEPLTALSRQLGVGNRITFHDFVDDGHLARFYENADLFLMPARQGYGIPAAEALSRGIPVLVHCESGISDILLDTPWATVMEGGEQAMVPALERAIAALLSRAHVSAPLPDLPTEDSWAEQVARICGWYGGDG